MDANTRNELNLLLDGNARLIGLSSDLSQRKLTARIYLIREPGDGTADYKAYDLCFTHITAVEIRSVDRRYPLPAQLLAVPSPSIELVEFLCGMFRDEAIYEFDTFREAAPSSSEELGMEPLHIELENDATISTECVSFFTTAKSLLNLHVTYGAWSISHHQETIEVSALEHAKQFLFPPQPELHLWRLTGELTGATYHALLDLALGRCRRFSFHRRVGGGLGERTGDLERRLQPFQANLRDPRVEEMQKQVWSGSNVRIAAIYRLTPESLCLLREAPGLYAWRNPERPDSLCLYTDNGETWLHSDAESRSGWIEDPTLTLEELLKLIPGLQAEDW